MSIPTSCSHCDESLKVPSKFLGKAVKCPSCKKSFEVVEDKDRDEQREVWRPPNYLGYDEWILAIMLEPAKAGREMHMLVFGTLLIVVVLTYLFGTNFFKQLPAGRYPRIVIALPFLVVATISFFILSAVFYPMYRQRKGKEPRNENDEITP